MALTVPLSEIVERSNNRLLGKHESWGRVLLGDVATVLNGFAFKSSKFSNSGGVPLIRIRDVGKDRSETTYLGEYDHRYVVEPGDLLVGMDGDFNCARWRGPSGLLNQRVCKITLKNDIYLPKFLDYALPGYLKAINDVTSSVTVKHLSCKSIEEIPLPLPPKEVQQRLVAEIEKQFSRLDEAVANLKRVKANLKRYKAAVLKAAVEGCLVSTEAELSRQAGRSYETAAQLLKANEQGSSSKPTKRRAGRLWGSGHVPQLTPDELAKLPEGWTWAKVRQVGSDPEDTVQVGPMSMRSDDFIESGVPVLNVGCVQWGRFDETKLNFLPEKIAVDFSRYRIQPGDVLFTRSGTVGRCAVAKCHQKNWLMTFHLLRARPSPNCCLPEYLRAVFEGAAHIRRQTKEASIGTTRAGFNTNLLANLDVPLPPMAEQQRIVAEVERRLSVIEELEAAVDANLTRADRVRQSILHYAFTGKLPRR